MSRKAKHVRGDGPIRLGKLPGQLVKLLDELAIRLTASDTYGRAHTRTDALRRAVIDGLKANGLDLQKPGAKIAWPATVLGVELDEKVAKRLGGAVAVCRVRTVRQ